MNNYRIKRSKSLTLCGFHHIYGNAKAMEGYKAGKFDDGFIDNLHSGNTGSIGEPGKKPEERIKFPQIRIQ